MPLFFYLPFIIATGMFSVAAQSLSCSPKKAQATKRNG